MIGAMAKEPKAFKVLGFDCAGRGCAAAVLAGGSVLARRAESMERGQAERLMSLIAETLKEAGLAPGELDLIAVTTGPGGFTGIRIGLAAARGLALAAGIPAAGVSNFAASAASVPPPARGARVLVAAIESKREEFYLQAFAASGAARGEGALVHPRDLEAFLPAGRLLLTGDAAARLLPWLKHRDAVIAEGSGPPDPVVVARLGLELWQKGEAPPPRPLYLRAPDTTAPRARKTPGVKAGI
jgi:tRNA threonylcarbamoyladenosine biosynthesis protein TsaB